MDPLIMGGLAGGALGNIGGALIGSAASAEDREKQRMLIDKMVQQLEAAGIPPIEAQKLALEKFQYEGDYTPQMESDILQGDSALSDYSADPELKTAQRNALLSLQGIADDGGMTLEDEANLNRILSSTAAADEGRRGAILQRMGRQGRMGSGFQLTAELQNAQDAATNANQQGLDIAAMAQKRALDAIMSGGQLAGQIRGQEFGEAKDIAGSEDAISRFNTMTRQGVQQRNVASGNEAETRNLDARQAIRNANTEIGNQEQVHNKGLYQQQFNNQLNKANSYLNPANAYGQQGAQTQALWGGVGQGLGQLGSSLATYGVKRKKNEE